jgi:hypothetical protein
LIPKGLYRTQEENVREIEDNAGEDDDAAVKQTSTKDMGWMDMWVHHTPSILNQGRLTHMEGKPVEGEEEVEPEEI